MTSENFPKAGFFAMCLALAGFAALSGCKPPDGMSDWPRSREEKNPVNFAAATMAKGTDLLPQAVQQLECGDFTEFRVIKRMCRLTLKDGRWFELHLGAVKDYKLPSTFAVRSKSKGEGTANTDYSIDIAEVTTATHPKEMFSALTTTTTSVLQAFAESKKEVRVAISDEAAESYKAYSEILKNEKVSK